MLVTETETNEHDNPVLSSKVEGDTPIKEWIVNYVGEHFESELERFRAEQGKEYEWDGSVTVEMIIELVAKQFPEFVMAIAEENFIRGYRQAFVDMEAGIQMAKADEATLDSSDG